MNIGNRERYYIYNRENKRCFYCSKKLEYHQMTLDHYLPSCSGGRGEIFNLVACCKSCNREKGNIIPEDYERVILKLFKAAVSDGFIHYKSNKINRCKLKSQLLQVKSVECIGSSFVLRSPELIFYVRNGVIIKTSPNACSKFQWL